MWLENKTGEVFQKIIPQNYVYKNLIYDDPTKNDGSTAELDYAIYYDRFLILIDLS